MVQKACAATSEKQSIRQRRRHVVDLRVSTHDTDLQNLPSRRKVDARLSNVDDTVLWNFRRKQVSSEQKSCPTTFSLYKTVQKL